jgi:hypothetical protein
MQNAPLHPRYFVPAIARHVEIDVDQQRVLGLEAEIAM